MFSAVSVTVGGRVVCGGLVLVMRGLLPSLDVVVCEWT